MLTAAWPPSTGVEKTQLGTNTWISKLGSCAAAHIAREVHGDFADLEQAREGDISAP
jgi:hypothetical protein